MAPIITKTPAVQSIAAGAAENPTNNAKAIGNGKTANNRNFAMYGNRGWGFGNSHLPEIIGRIFAHGKSIGWGRGMTPPPFWGNKYQPNFASKVSPFNRGGSSSKSAPRKVEVPSFAPQQPANPSETKNQATEPRIATNEPSGFSGAPNTVSQEQVKPSTASASDSTPAPRSFSEFSDSYKSASSRSRESRDRFQGFPDFRRGTSNSTREPSRFFPKTPMPSFRMPSRRF
jgi:hypothetical protein